MRENIIINFMKNVMDKISVSVIKFIFFIILIMAIIIKAVYRFDDSPAFVFVDTYDVIATIAVILIMAIIIKYRDRIQGNLNYKIIGLLFFASCIAYVMLVPLKPMGDMDGIYNGALLFCRSNWKEFYSYSYWNQFPFNMKLSILWGCLVYPFPKLIAFKIWNIIFAYLIIFFGRKLAKEYIKYYDIAYIVMVFFIPLILFVNNIYYDLIVVLLCLIGVYIFKKYNNIFLAFAILGLCDWIRQTSKIFAVAIIAVYIIENSNKIKNCKQAAICIGKIVISCLVYCAVIKLNDVIFFRIIDARIFASFKPYPKWNGYYIAINETEFGFMNNAELSHTRTKQELINRIVEYGPIRLIKIFLKKTFWLWSQGTYQAQRYAFGLDVINSSDKFEYKTILTQHLLNDGQKLRRIINATMRAEYLVLFSGMIRTAWRKESINKFRLFYYAFAAVFFIMLITELKSRYILFMFPAMIIMACYSIEEVSDK